MSETRAIQLVDPSDPDHLATVTQLAEELGITARTIRFYEDKGLLTPRRVGTTRIYTHRDRARMILILRGKRLGFSLREIKEYLDLYEIDRSQEMQMRRLLKLVEAREQDLEEQRAALDHTLIELNDIKLEIHQALEKLAKA